MKQRSLVFIIFLFGVILLIHSTTSSRLLPPSKDDHKVMDLMANGISQEGLSSKEDDLSNLMGLEECMDKDDECLKRRMVAEAHLDYIYTQHHKTKP